MKGTILCFFTDFSAMNKGNMFTIEKKDPTFLSYVITFGLVLEV